MRLAMTPSSPSALAAAKVRPWPATWSESIRRGGAFGLTTAASRSRRSLQGRSQIHSPSTCSRSNTT